MAKKNKLSIDDLGVMIKKGFDGQDKKFEKIDKRLSKLETGQKELKRNLAEVKMKFAYTAWQIDFEEMKKRMAKVEKKVGIKHQS